MKITYVNGDITKASEMVIVHGCNAQGVMGSGVAKAIRAKWPGAYERYKTKVEAFKKHTNSSVLLGNIILFFGADKVILNAITQEFYGQDGGIYASRRAIENVFYEIKELGIKQFAMPKIGCGLGGLDWDLDVLPIIEDVFAYYDIEITVYEL